MTIGLRTLVLHPDYSPINMFPLYTVPAEEAIVRVIQGNATCIQNFSRQVLTPSRDDLMWPSVIVNKKFYKKREEVQLKRETLFYRDHGVCVYCENPLTLTTITCDHVMPRDKGGHHGWDNVVASCKVCNAAKSNHLPKGKWAPKYKPHVPTVYELMDKRRKFPIIVDDPQWIDFIGNDKGWEGGFEVRKRARQV